MSAAARAAYLEAALREALRYQHAINWPGLIERLLDNAPTGEDEQP